VKKKKEEEEKNKKEKRRCRREEVGEKQTIQLRRVQKIVKKEHKEDGYVMLSYWESKPGPFHP
jgi:uncharacterized cupin superfamily protein